MKKIIFSIGVVTGIVLTGAYAAYAWAGPRATAPSENASAPVNLSSSNQTKDGGLTVGGVSGGFTVRASAYVQDRLGIAVSPSYPLDVAGDIHNTGNIYSAGYFHNVSDIRLKTNIQTIDGLATLSKLRGVTFNWKKDGTLAAGVIAQEVEAVMPEAVHTDADGIKSVAYDQLIAPLIEAIKEQQIQIDALQAEIEQLKK